MKRGIVRTHQQEIESGERFGFGENWARFLSGLNSTKIDEAVCSLQEKLGVNTLQGKTFLYIGSGSGLFSLAAHRLGARVRSFDFDPVSVGCTRNLKEIFATNCADWAVTEGSVLDDAFLRDFGCFDFVYSWGVLHHTGNMLQAWENAAACVAPQGTLFIAIYNDQGWVSRYWTAVKRLYNRCNLCKPFLILAHAPYLLGFRWLVRTVSRRPLERGMSLWHDMIDWLGGYPFEVARPERVLRFFRDRGFMLTEMTTCGGRMGCNEFVFKRH